MTVQVYSAGTDYKYGFVDDESDVLGYESEETLLKYLDRILVAQFIGPESRYFNYPPAIVISDEGQLLDEGIAMPDFMTQFDIEVAKGINRKAKKTVALQKAEIDAYIKKLSIARSSDVTTVLEANTVLKGDFFYEFEGIAYADVKRVRYIDAFVPSVDGGDAPGCLLLQRAAVVTKKNEVLFSDARFVGSRGETEFYLEGEQI